MIQAIANELETSPDRPLEIQLTFLDPYLRSDLEGRDAFGEGANWSDDYYTPVDELDTVRSLGQHQRNRPVCRPGLDEI